MLKNYHVIIFLLLAATLTCCQADVTLPASGDGARVFREYAFNNYIGAHTAVMSPLAWNASEQDYIKQQGPTVTDWLDINDLQQADGAEIVLAYWGGHLGTSDQKFRINDGPWRPIPQPNAPTPPQAYYRTLLDATVPVPLSELKQGRNKFEFACGKQIVSDFGIPFFWVYSFTARIDYSLDKPHPTGTITAPTVGGAIGDFPHLTASVQRAGSPIRQVDFIGEYDDFNWEGDGVSRQWHMQLPFDQLRHHIGSAYRAPYTVTWNTTWVPDQDQPIRLLARITDASGLTYATPAVNGILLKRAERSVKIYRPQEIPSGFSASGGKWGDYAKRCNIPVTDDPKLATAAALELSTWSAAHASSVAFECAQLTNYIGRVHNFSYDCLAVPVKQIRQDVDNAFVIMSINDGHAAEINWPGPALLMQFGKPATLPADPALRAQRDLICRTYAGKKDTLDEIAESTPLTTRRLAHFTGVPAVKDNAPETLVFTSTLDVPRDDIYTFTTTSYCPQTLYIDGQRVVENDGTFDGVAENLPARSSNAIGLAIGRHRVQLLYAAYQNEGNFTICWESPQIPRCALPIPGEKS